MELCTVYRSGYTDVETDVPVSLSNWNAPRGETEGRRYSGPSDIAPDACCWETASKPAIRATPVGPAALVISGHLAEAPVAAFMKDRTRSERSRPVPRPDPGSAEAFGVDDRKPSVAASSS
jgi:hypothetical protein